MTPDRLEQAIEQIANAGHPYDGGWHEDVQKILTQLVEAERQAVLASIPYLQMLTEVLRLQIELNQMMKGSQS